MRAAFLFVAAVGLSPAAAYATSPLDPLDQLTGHLGIDKHNLRPDPIALLSSRDQRGQSPLLRAVFSDQLRAGWRAGMIERRFAGRLDSVHRLMLLTSTLTGTETARGYLGNPLAGLDSLLLESVDPLALAVGLVGGDPTTVPSEAEFPLPARFELARLVATTAHADQFRRRSFRALPAEFTATLLLGQVENGRFGDDDLDYRVLLDRVEFEALAAGMLDLTAAAEDFVDYLRHADSLPGMDWQIDTPNGAILWRGSPANHEWKGAAPLLSVDLYGDDVVEITPMDSAPHTSIIIDREGNDQWIGPVGRGLMGYAILWDLAGDDLYDAGRFAQASAMLGGALLVDESGDDVYQAIQGSQSFALGGGALLLDRAGTDRYDSRVTSQASGGPRGAAVLIDVEGDDVYTMTGPPIIRPSAQLPQRNSTQGQGCGWGLRADLSDGRSLAGGVGMLIDLAGNDNYAGEVICQGAGFLEGVGILVDHAGDDVYTAAWYGMAAGAHRAVGILVDRGGNDSYTASHYTSISAAHDGSVTALIDEGGNDRYAVRNLGIGGAHDNGFALFVDAAGDDRYTLQDREAHGLGSALITHYGSIREGNPGTGLFLDLGGRDAYEVLREGPADGSLWKGPSLYPDLALPAERGAGLDGEFPKHGFRTVPQTESSPEDERILLQATEERRAYRTKLPKRPEESQRVTF